MEKNQQSIFEMADAQKDEVFNAILRRALEYYETHVGILT